MEQEVEAIRIELKKVVKLAEENNAMLHAIQHRARMSLLWSIFRWVLVVALAIGAFYWIMPYLDQLAVIYQKVTGNKLDFIELFRHF